MADPDHPFQLELGGSLPVVHLAYETWGSLSAARDNAVLVCHALTGDSHVASHPETPGSPAGWWEAMVGPGRPLDTRRFFVICVNVLGGCGGSTGPTSPHPDDGRPYRRRFPLITIRDMVRAQHQLLLKLGIPKLRFVIGGSMGGMQALEWALMYPEAVGALVSIAAPLQHSAQAIALNAVQREIILSFAPGTGPAGDFGLAHQPPEPGLKTDSKSEREPGCTPESGPGSTPGAQPGPESEAGVARGLALARMLGMITYQSWESMEQKFGRRPAPGSLAAAYIHAGSSSRASSGGVGYAYGDSSLADGSSASQATAADGSPATQTGASGDQTAALASTLFEVQRYLHYQGQKLVRRFDPDSYLYLSFALDLHDVGAGRGGLEAALERLTMPVLAVGIRSDILYPPHEQQLLVQFLTNLGRPARYAELDSPWGHDAFLIEAHALGQLLRDFLTTPPAPGELIAAPLSQRPQPLLTGSTRARLQPGFRYLGPDPDQLG
ncbi:MAG: alpha/beta fold hydrolase [Limnochordaceae bacterium]|nr:alpha/beta fold hydrolase [Limnochordaceae bacterium]